MNEQVIPIMDNLTYPVPSTRNQNSAFISIREFEPGIEEITIPSIGGTEGRKALVSSKNLESFCKAYLKR